MPYPEMIAHYPKSMQVFIKTVHNRVDNGKNCLIPFTGQTGSGKSLSTISLMIGLHLYRHGEMPTPEFIVNRVKFRALDMMAEFNREDLEKKGSWGWDEAGVDIGHKTHASVQNKVVGWLVQTFRNLQQVVFFTVPSMSFLDATVRKMLHITVETKAIDHQKKICICKPLMMQYNERQDKIYFHNLSYRGEDGYFDVVDLMGIPLPPKEFVELYERGKNKFTRELNLEIQATLQMLENKKKPILSPRQKEVLDIIESGEINQSKIAERLGISQPAVSGIFMGIRKKGIKIEQYKNIPTQ